MIVVDHEPSGWFLLMDGDRVLLDVNCSYGAVSYPFLMELSESERAAYAASGHAFISKLAEQIQHSAPGVIGNASTYRERSLGSADRLAVDQVTIAWLKARAGRTMYDWIKLVTRAGQTVHSPSQVDLESALMDLFGSSRDDEHPNSWIECGCEGGALHTLSIFQSGKAIYVRYSDADMSTEEEQRQLTVRSVPDAMFAWNAVIEGRQHEL
jgi:hypothetical protein